MNKFFDMSEDIQELCSQVMGEETPGLMTMGLNFKYLGTTKQNTVIKVSKGNPITEFMINETQTIIICIYEAAFDRLTDEYKRLVLASAFASIEFDAEKDKITISGNNGTSLSEAMYLKYKEPAVLSIFNGYAAIRQIQEEEKEAKALAAAEREEKRKLKNA